MNYIEPKCVVYIAVNLNNDKLYIGATDCGLYTRRKRHIANANRGQKSKFYSAIRKHGVDSFEFIRFAICRDFFHALDVEAELIKILKPAYNMTAGGGGSKGVFKSPETREKIAAAHRGKPSKKKGIPIPESVKYKVSIGVSKWWENKRKDENYMKSFLERRKIASSHVNDSKKKKVTCCNDGKEFDSIAEAARYYNVTTGQVCYSCINVNHNPRTIPKFSYIS